MKKRRINKKKHWTLYIVLSTLIIFQQIHVFGLSGFETFREVVTDGFLNGLTVDQDGNVYVAYSHWEDPSIRKISPTGDLEQILGEGIINNPIDVAVDKDGNIYVLERGFLAVHKVVMLNWEGTFVAEWDGPDTKITEPHGLAVDQNKNIYIADSKNHRIIRFKFETDGTVNEEQVKIWKTKEGGENLFSWPYGIAVDDSGYIYVGDSDNHRIVVFKPDENGEVDWERVWYIQGIGGETDPGEDADDIDILKHLIARVTWVKVDHRGNIYIPIFGEKCVAKFKLNSEGTIDKDSIAIWKPGSGYDFAEPRGIAVDRKGNIFVSDQSNAIRRLSAPPDQLSMLQASKSSITLDVDESYSLTVTAVYDSGNRQAITQEATYSSGNQEIVSVSNTGLITALSEGESVITVNYKGKETQVTVKVIPKADIPVIPPIEPPADTPVVPPADTQTPGSSNIQKGGSAIKTSDNLLIDETFNSAKTRMFKDKKGIIEIDYPANAVGVEAGFSLRIIVTKMAEEEAEKLVSQLQKPEGLRVLSDIFEYSFKKTEKDISINALDIPVQVTLSLTPKQLERVRSAEKVGLYQIDNKGLVKFVGGRLKDGKLIVPLKSEGRFFVGEATLTFHDITGHWAQKDIEIMASRFIAEGYLDGSFNPNAFVTREDLALMCAKLIDLKADNAENLPPFTDVKPEDRNYQLLMRASQSGIITGYPDGSFKPKALVTREEMAVMISRMSIVKEITKELSSEEYKILLSQFYDHEKIGKWAEPSVVAVVKMGVMQGRKNNYLKGIMPKENITRAEALVMLKRVYDEQ